jgi:hypothetical protein
MIGTCGLGRNWPQSISRYYLRCCCREENYENPQPRQPSNCLVVSHYIYQQWEGNDYFYTIIKNQTSTKPNLPAL